MPRSIYVYRAYQHQTKQHVEPSQPQRAEHMESRASWPNHGNPNLLSCRQNHSPGAHDDGGGRVGRVTAAAFSQAPRIVGPCWKNMRPLTSINRQTTSGFGARWHHARSCWSTPSACIFLLHDFMFSPSHGNIALLFVPPQS